MPHDPNRVKEIFLEAAEQPDEAARAAYVDRACGGDAGLRDRVEALLRSHDPSGSFLSEPVAVVSDADAGTMVINSSDFGDRSADPDDLHFLQPSTRPDSLGRIGHYEVLQVLGKGGFGIVFRAFDENLQRVVAIKVLAPAIAATSPARKRFLREARSSAAVRHDNVVHVYDVIEQPLPYLVMEFIPGETLQQRLDRIGPLEVSEVLRIGRQIAEGLAAAHASELIHRDIKPANVLLEGGSQKAKITDFGLARAADDASMTRSGVIAGTPNFMAPEQALGQHIDQRADLFSLGSVLYQMVSGRAPFRAPSTLAVLKRVAEEPPRRIPEIIPETPDWLCGIIARLHAKNPDDRFQSAREVADVLADCEAQLKSKQDVRNILPSSVKSQVPTASGGRQWAAAAVVLFAVIALAVTEFAGVTHLFRGRELTPVTSVDPPKQDDPPARVDPAVRHENEAPPPEAPSIHDVWLRAVAIVPLEEHRSALAARMQERLPGFDEAFLKAIPAVAANRQPVMVDLWLNERQPAFAGWEEAWLKAIPSMTADTQVVVVAAWLRELNPGFDGSVTHTITDGVVTNLEVPSSIVQDLTPLRALTSLRTLTCRSTVGQDLQAENDAAVLASLMALETINDKPAAQLLNEIAAWQAEFEEWLHLVPELSAEQQVRAVSAKLMERNPGFDGEMEHKIEDGVVTEVRVVTDRVADISPLLALGGLRVLNCSGTPTPDFQRGNGQLADLTPLTGMNLAGLTELDLAWTRVGDAGLVLFKDCRNLTRLNLRSTHVTDAGLAHFKDCKNLSVLHLSYTRTSDAGCALFKDCRNLTVLDLAMTQVTDAGLAHFKDCKDLEQLSLWMTQVGDAGLAHFTGSKELVLLDLHDTQVGDAGLASFRDCKDVLHLDLHNTRTSDAGIASFKDCTNLTYLDLHDSQVTDLACLKDCRNLTHLNLAGTPVNDAGLAHLDGLDRLTELHLSGTQVTDAGLACFQDCQSLTHLALDDCHQISDAGLAHFQDCKGLTAINLSGTQVRDAGLAHFDGLDGLNQLYLTGTQVTDVGLACFQDCKNLTILDLHNTQVGDTGLAHFAGLDRLTHLYLTQTQVTDVGLAHFQDCKNLTVLALDDCRQITDAGLAHFRDCTNLTQLGLHNTQVTNAGLAHFQDFKNLTVLELRNTQVTDLSLLKGLPLQELWCDFQPDRDAEILRAIPTLKTINGESADEFWKRLE